MIALLWVLLQSVALRKSILSKLLPAALDVALNVSSEAALARLWVTPATRAAWLASGLNADSVVQSWWDQLEQLLAGLPFFLH